MAFNDDTWRAELDAEVNRYRGEINESRRADAERLVRMSANDSEPVFSRARGNGWVAPALVGGLVGYLLGKRSGRDDRDDQS
jgi:hypothetical protein